MADERLTQQIAFLLEADKLKAVLRRTALMDGSRQENSAEHSWHLALAALVMSEYASQPLNLVRVLEMLAVHDLVEIDAGDTFAYDQQNAATKADREQIAAERIFSILPTDQSVKFRLLWEEFEEQETAESKFANAMDRLQPLLLNAFSGGGSWCNQGLTRAQVLRRMAPIEGAMPKVWPMILETIESFCQNGVLKYS